MNGWGFLFWLAPVLAVFSIELVMLAVLMRPVGRISTRALLAMLAADFALWMLAVFGWLGR